MYNNVDSDLDSDLESNSTDNEYDGYDSDNDTISNILYEPEEVSPSKFNIVLCELYNEDIHGTTNSINLQTSYFVLNRYKYFELDVINNDCVYYNSQYNNIVRNTLIRDTFRNHPTIKNYLNIISSPSYIKPELSKCIYLNTGECVCILKTLWLRLIQRTWKKIYAIQNNVIKKRCSVKSLHYREITGKWPDDCIKMPTMKGMLSYLSK